jgi:hypothetical protein
MTPSGNVATVHVTAEATGQALWYECHMNQTKSVRISIYNARILGPLLSTAITLRTSLNCCPTTFTHSPRHI